MFTQPFVGKVQCFGQIWFVICKCLGFWQVKHFVVQLRDKDWLINIDFFGLLWKVYCKYRLSVRVHYLLLDSGFKLIYPSLNHGHNPSGAQ